MSHPLVTPPSGPPVHQARLQVSAELIHEMLKMPRETRILSVTFDGRTFEFTLEDPRLSGVEDGQIIPTITPIYTSFMPTAGLLVQAAWIFEDSTETTGDTFPDDDLTEKEFVHHDHIWPRAEFGEACEICGYPLTHALLDESPRVSGTDPHGKDA